MIRRRARPTVSKPRAGRKVEFDGHKFDSVLELHRYGELRLLERAGAISELEVHPKLSLEVNGKKIGRGFIVLDFRYLDRGGGTPRLVYEDVKGVDTRESRLRRELAEAIHGIEIKVTGGK